MNCPQRQHTDPLFKVLRIMTIDEIIKFKLCKLAYCLKENIMPSPILELFNAIGKKTHWYSTRYKNLPNIKNTLVLNIIEVFCARV